MTMELSMINLRFYYTYVQALVTNEQHTCRHQGKLAAEAPRLFQQLIDHVSTTTQPQ